MNRIYTRLLSIVENGKAGFFYLIDPDKLSLQNISQVVQGIQKGGCDAILVGGSFLFTNHFDDFIRLVKNETDLPVIIFPGNSRQISAAADAILFLNFILVIHYFISSLHSLKYINFKVLSVTEVQT
ncbi:hypothetical protein IIC38_11780 [candidate division KSB1 bacterium]|nr:hypothetical protein [candidate division KSB1 bacterium]